MRVRIRNHVRSNVVGYVALFLAMGGSATALNGRNTVFSDDIVNGQVKKQDVARNAVTSEKIKDGQVRRADIAGSAVVGSKIADDGLTGADVANNSLTGADITGLTGEDLDEGTLDPVPKATIAGRGRSAQGTNCDPESTAYVSCASVTFTLPENGRVLMHGYGTGYTEADSDLAVGSCALFTSATGGFPETALVTADDNSGGEFAISTVTPVLGAGPVTFEVHCNQLDGAILYEKVGVSAVQFGAS